MWKKFHLLLFVTCFLLFTRGKKICLWTLWNFSWPTATRNFKIVFTRKFSSPLWTGEKRSLTVDEIFFTQKRDNYTNKVLFYTWKNWVSFDTKGGKKIFKIWVWRIWSVPNFKNWACSSADISMGSMGSTQLIDFQKWVLEPMDFYKICI